MAMRMRVALWGGCLMVALTVQGASLNELRSIYRSKLGEVQRELITQRGEIGHAYEAELRTQLEQAHLRGDGTTAREITLELKRFAKHRSLPQKRIHRAVSTVASTAVIYHGRLQEEVRLNAQSVITLATQYDGALASLEKQLASRPAEQAVVQQERAFLATSAEVVQAQRDLAMPEQAAESSRGREAAEVSTATDAGSLALRKRRPSMMNQRFALTFEGDVAASPGVGVSVSAEGVTPTLAGRFGKGARLDSRGSLEITPFKVKERGTVALWLKPSEVGQPSKSSRALLSSAGQGVSFFYSRQMVQPRAPYHTERGFKGVQIGAEQWIHLALTWSPQVVNFYANGVLVESRSVTDGRKDDAGSREMMHIGVSRRHNRRKSSAQALGGVVDDVMAYDRALSVEEVAVLAGK